MKATVLIKSINEKLIETVMRVQEEIAKEAWADIIADAPLRTGNYISSIEVSETKENNGVISTEVYSDLKVGHGDWENVPLAALLEWGTGRIGQSTNEYPHGFGYRQNGWIYFDEELQSFFYTEGMAARPHFYPALQKYTPIYLDRLKKELK